MSDQRNYGTLDLHLHGEQITEPRYFPPNSHGSIREAYGRFGVRGHGASVTLYFESRAQVTAIREALAALETEWPEPAPESVETTRLICRICQEDVIRAAADTPGTPAGTALHANYMTRKHDHGPEPVPYTGPATPPARGPEVVPAETQAELVWCESPNSDGHLGAHKLTPDCRYPHNTGQYPEDAS